MGKILLILSLAFCCASAVFIDETSNRISAGNNASESQFPFVVSIQAIQYLPNQLQAHRCGGALITYQHVLTSAYCMYETINGTVMEVDASAYRVYAGGALLTGDSQAERTRLVQNFTVHPEYLIYPAQLNDIAVLTLVSPFLNTTVVPIPYAINDVVLPDFTVCTLVGWGMSDITATAATNDLRFANKYTYNHSLCTSLYNSLAYTTNIHASMMCAASYDIFSVGCHGDEGNALICNGELTGILSVTNRCIVTSYPEIYTRVSNYTTWIKSVTGGTSTFKSDLGLFGLLAIICIKIFS